MQLPLRMIAAGACAALVLGLSGCDKPVVEEPADVGMRIYVPCGMEMPFLDLKKAFQEAHPDTTITLMMDNSAILVDRVLDKGERADVLVSPGGVEFARLVETGLVDEEAIRHFGEFELLLFGPRANEAGVTGLADVAKDAVKVVAIADPDRTSVGHFARQVLKDAGLWEAVQPKLTITKDPLASYKMAIRGEADVSFAYRSCPLKTAPDKIEYSKVKIFGGFPAGSYGPAYASVVVLKNSPVAPLASAFVDVLTGPDGQATFRDYDVPAVGSIQPVAQ